MTKKQNKVQFALYVIPENEPAALFKVLGSAKEACKEGCKVLESNAFTDIRITRDRGV